MSKSKDPQQKPKDPADEKSSGPAPVPRKMPGTPDPNTRVSKMITAYMLNVPPYVKPDELSTAVALDEVVYYAKHSDRMMRDKLEAVIQKATQLSSENRRLTNEVDAAQLKVTTLNNKLAEMIDPENPLQVAQAYDRLRGRGDIVCQSTDSLENSAVAFENMLKRLAAQISDLEDFNADDDFSDPDSASDDDDANTLEADSGVLADRNRDPSPEEQEQEQEPVDQELKGRRRATKSRSRNTDASFGAPLMQKQETESVPGDAGIDSWLSDLLAGPVVAKATRQPSASAKPSKSSRKPSAKQSHGREKGPSTRRGRKERRAKKGRQGRRAKGRN